LHELQSCDIPTIGHYNVNVISTTVLDNRYMDTMALQRASVYCSYVGLPMNSICKPI